ncbi:6375_t:CDS:2, partial [Scutellospora calospora]
MTSDSSYVRIQFEDEIANEIKKISEIVCSPNMKHVAALDEDSNISFWSIDNEDQSPKKVNTIHIDTICTKAKGDRLFAISDNMFTSIGLERINPYNFKIFDFKTEDEVMLTFPDWQKEIDFLSFIDNGNIVMINTKYYRAYIFSSKDDIHWFCKSMVELKYFKQIYITLKGKLIIFNDTIYEIRVWDIETLSVKTHALIEWNCTLESVEISDDEELLLICAKSEATKETRLYVFSTETGINLAFYRFHLIASSKGERLFYVLDDPLDKKYNIMDPYNLTNPIDASKLFENNQVQEPYLIRSDKIIYIIDGKLSIKDLVQDNSYDWIKYLRRELNDTNSITAPSKNTFEIIKNSLNKDYNDTYISYNKVFQGVYLKWELEFSNKSVMITVIEFDYHKNDWNDSEKRKIEILPSFYSDEKKFILHCEVLENDDFFTITHIGVIIWTFKFSKATKTKIISMHYYWNGFNDCLEKFAFDRDFDKFNHDRDFDKFKHDRDFDKFMVKHLFESWTSERILPASSYETIYFNLDVKFGGTPLFLEFLKDNINEEFYLTCYGNILMRTFSSLKDDKWIRTVGDSCINKCLHDNNHLIFKISLLSIIFENIVELSENQPAFIASIFSMVAFVVPSTIINQKSHSLHLSSFGRYYHLSRTSSLDILTSNFWNSNLYFQFQNGFRKFLNSLRALFSCFESLLLVLISVPSVVLSPLLLLVNRFYSINQNPTIVLAFPIPNFVSYSKYYNWKELIRPIPNSFISSNHLEKINYEFYKYLNGRALLEFKWKFYGKKYYLVMWAIYTVFLYSFITVSSLSNDNSQKIFLIITIILGFWHLIFEIRSFIYFPLGYFSRIWNYL